MDQTLFYLINHQWTTSFLDQLMASITSFDAWRPVYIVLIIAFILFGKFKARSFVIVTLFSLMIVDGLFTRNLKIWIHRPRPPEAMEGVRKVDLQHVQPSIVGITKPVKITYSLQPLPNPHGKSFPSGHTMNNILIATFAVLYFQLWGILYVIPALIICYSRVYCGAHWVSDVVFSFFISIILSLLLYKMWTLIYKRLMPKFFPKFYEKHPDLIHSAH